MTQRKQVDFYKGTKTLGLDVSTYQGNVDWMKVDEDFKFVFVRTGDGKSEDAKFVKNWQGAAQRGLYRGVYHYLRADRDGMTQATHVATLIRKAGGLLVTDLPPVIDIEEGASKNLEGGVFEGTGTELPIELVVAECLEFLDALEVELGVRPIVYTGQAFHWWLSQSRPQLAEKFAKYPLWIASYTTSDAPYMPVDKAGKAFPWAIWTFWQYTSKGASNGIVGDIDMNYFRGDVEELKRFIRDSRILKEEKPVEVPVRETVSTSTLKDLDACILQAHQLVDDLIRIKSQIPK